MDEKTWLIIYVVIGWATAIVIEIQCNSWKRKHDDAITAWTIESNNKDKQILKLQEELKNLKAKPVKHGKWIDHKKFERKNCNVCIECSVCNTWFGHDCIPKTKFCPNCGARMDLKDGDAK